MHELPPPYNEMMPLAEEALARLAGIPFTFSTAFRMAGLTRFGIGGHGRSLRRNG